MEKEDLILNALNDIKSEQSKINDKLDVISKAYYQMSAKIDTIEKDVDIVQRTSNHCIFDDDNIILREIIIFFKDKKEKITKALINEDNVDHSILSDMVKKYKENNEMFQKTKTDIFGKIIWLVVGAVIIVVISNSNHFIELLKIHK